MSSLPVLRKSEPDSDSDEVPQKPAPPPAGFRGGVIKLLQQLILFLYSPRLGDLSRRIKLAKLVRPSVRMFDGPFILGNGGRWHYGVELLPLGSNYTNRSKAKQARLLGNLESIICDDHMMGRHMRLYGLTDPLDVGKLDAGWMRQLVAGADGELIAINRRHRERQKRKLQHAGFRNRRLYATLQLKESWSPLAFLVLQLEILFGRNPLAAYGRAEQRYSEQVEAFHSLLNNHGFDKSRALTQSELYGLVQHEIFPGQDDLPELGIDDAKPLSDYGVIRRITESVAKDLHYELMLDREGHQSYVSYLALAEAPRIPLWEFLFQSDPDGRPVEFVVDMEMVAPQKIVTKAARKSTLLREKRKELKKDGGYEELKDDNSPQGQQRIVDEYAEHGKADRATVKFSAVLRPSAPVIDDNHVEARKKLRATRGHLEARAKRKGFHFLPDQANQLEIRRSLLPGNKCEYDTYQQEFSTHCFAAGMPHASSKFGNDGALHGVVLAQKDGQFYELSPFLYSHSHALWEDWDTNTAQVINGGLGTGKTWYAIEVAAGDAQDGMSIIFLEGKGDTGLITDIPNVRRVEHLDLKRSPGALNPGMLGRTRQEKRENITDFLTQLGRKSIPDHSRWKAPLTLAVERMLNDNPEAPDMVAGIRLMMDGEFDVRGSHDGRDLGIALAGWTQMEGMEGFFSNATTWHEMAKYSEPGVITFVRYSGFAIPNVAQNDPSKYSDPELAAILARRYATQLFARVAENRDHPVHIFVDEFTLDLRLGGLDYFDRIARTGRAFQTLITVMSQSLRDFPESIWAYISTVIILGVEEQEVDLALIALGLGDTSLSEAERQEFKQKLINMSTRDETDISHRGEAYVRILGRQVGFVRFHDIYLEGGFISNVNARIARKREEEERRIREEKPPVSVVVGHQPTRERAFQAMLSLGITPSSDTETNRVLEELMTLADDEAYGLLTDGRYARMKFSNMLASGQNGQVARAGQVELSKNNGHNRRLVGQTPAAVGSRPTS